MKNYMRMCLLALSLISLSACNSKKEMANQSEKSYETPFEVLIQDSNLFVEEEKSVIIKNQTELEELYAILNSKRSPGFEIPNVNFKEQCVIFVTMGQKNSGGYKVAKPQFTDRYGIYYDFGYEFPLTSSPVTMAMTTPGIVVLANQSADRIEVRVNDL
jgi:hypothetical protein